MTSPSLLAIDTATETCSVALLWRGALHLRSQEVGQKHSEHALPMVDSLFRDNAISLKQVDFLAFGAGPGSFTGLRIACGLAQGLAWGAGKRIIAVGNLLAMASRAFQQGADFDVVLCAIDARMHEAYCAIYRRAEIPIEIEPPSLIGAAQLAALALRADAIAGDALKAFPASFRDAPITRFEELRADAGDIARIASSPTMIAGAVEPQSALPLYVRDRVALTTEERRARSAAS